MLTVVEASPCHDIDQGGERGGGGNGNVFVNIMVILTNL